MVIFMTFAIAGIFLILESTVRAEKCNQVVLERTMTMIGVNEKQKTDSKKNFGEYLSIADSQNADLFNNASAIEDDDGTKRNEEVLQHSQLALSLCLLPAITIRSLHRS